MAAKRVPWEIGNCQAVPVPDGPGLDPVFILTAPRSYSTVTTAMLAGHPALYGFPELLLNSGHTVASAFGDELKEEKLNWRLTGLCRTLAELHEGLQCDDSLDRARKWLTGHINWTGRQVMDYLLATVHPRIGLEKSVATSRSDEALARCLGGYPNARYIHLTRHPVMACQSLERQLVEMFKEDPAFSAIASGMAARAVELWLTTNRRIVQALCTLPVRQWIRVRAEDLLMRPHTYCPRVLRWLGLPGDETIIARMLATERWRFADTSQISYLGGGDPVFFESPSLQDIPEPGPVNFDPAMGLSAELIAATSELAADFGY